METLVDLSLDAKTFRAVYNRKKTIATYTLGCKVNQYETTAIEEIFMDAGYEMKSFDEIADVYLINTCTVTGMSEQKCRQIIRKSKKINPYAKVVVSGCYSQKEPKKVLELEGVNLVFGTSNRKAILSEIESLSHEDKKIFVENIMNIKAFEELKVKSASDRTRAYIKVQDGCDRYCSYCIIPYTRGKIRSRDVKSVIEESRSLIAKGYKEIVLTGIHIASYGRDTNTTNLKELIIEISNLEGLQRLRTSSMEPLIITDDFVSEIKRLKNFCPHFHLSLQSGSNSVLKRMNRKYTREEYLSAVLKIRDAFPEAAITTDIIVGFPGETEEEFMETVEFLKDINLYEMHIFKFSPREGTPAASMKEQVSADIKHQRSKILLDMSKQNKASFNNMMVGKEQSVLFESYENGINIGHTTNYVTVHMKNNENFSKRVLSVKIVDANENFVEGIIV